MKKNDFKKKKTRINYSSENIDNTEDADVEDLKEFIHRFAFKLRNQR